MTDDPITKLAFSMYENNGVYALLLGSGTSSAAGIPTGWQITLDLVRRVALAENVPEQSDWEIWYSDRYGKQPSYSRLLAKLAVTSAERRAVLENYIEPSDDDRTQGRKIPTAGHHAIARLVRDGFIRVIITTNFDRLIENALRDAGVEPTIVSSEDALKGAQPLAHSNCYVFKLHGDYKDNRILNTAEELADYPPAYNKLLDRIFDEYGLIVCGWSAEWDLALRAAIERAPSRRFPTWWITRSEPSELTSRLMKHRGAAQIAESGFIECFAVLEKQVELIAGTQRASPPSLAMLSATVKKYVAKPEFAADLDQVVSDETDQLFARLAEIERSLKEGSDIELIKARVRHHEAATEGWLTVAGILGRWGSDEDQSNAVNVVKGVLERDRTNKGGLVHLIGLRSYPAVLIFTSYCLGLTRSKRWELLFRTLNEELHRHERKPERLVDLLAPDNWAGGNKEVWSGLIGEQKFKTPLSDHLLEKFRVHGRTIFGPMAELEYYFAFMELMGAIAWYDRLSIDDRQRRADLTNDFWHDMPLGRLTWQHALFARLEGEVSTPKLKEQILKANFAHGNHKVLDAFFKAARKKRAYPWH